MDLIGPSRIRKHNVVFLIKFKYSSLTPRGSQADGIGPEEEWNAPTPNQDLSFPTVSGLGQR